MRSPAWVRAGLAVVVAVYLVYSSFGVAAPFLWGHHGYHGATYLQRAKMSLRFHMLTPANWSGYEVPPRTSYYLHHPIGYHHVLTALVPIFGAPEWLARAVAAAGGLLVLGALFLLTRRWWSPPAGLLAVAVYVALPILCSFSILSDPMLPAMTCCIITAQLYLSYLEQPRYKTLLWACALYVLGGLLMWEAYFQALFHGLHALWWSRRSGRAVRLGRHSAGLAWFFITGVCSTLTIAFHLGYTYALGTMGDFMESYRLRHGVSFSKGLSQHLLWFKLLYGWPLCGLGILWLILFLRRAARGQARRRDQAVLIFFLINCLYINLFAEGSSVHEYRVFWFSSFLALAVTDLIGELYLAVRRRRPERPRQAVAVAVGACALYFAIIGPHAYRNLLESRVMMGTHGQLNYDPDYAKLRFAKEVARRLGPNDYYFIHGNLPRRVEFNYYLDHSFAGLPSLSLLPELRRNRPRAVVVMDANVTGVERSLLIELLKKYPGYFYDHYLLVDLRDPRPQLREYRFTAQPMSRAWRWFVSHKYPPLEPVEVQTTNGQCLYVATGVRPPADLPPASPPPPGNVDLALCYHNFLVLRGHSAQAAAYRNQLLVPADRRNVALPGFGQILGLAGSGRQRGVELFLLAEQPLARNAQLKARLVPEAAAPSSGVVPPPLPVIQAFPLQPGQLTATPGFLQRQALVWSPRPGRYHLRVTIESAASHATEALAEADLGIVQIF